MPKETLIPTNPTGRISKSVKCFVSHDGWPMGNKKKRRGRKEKGQETKAAASAAAAENKANPKRQRERAEAEVTEVPAKKATTEAREEEKEWRSSFRPDWNFLKTMKGYNRDNEQDVGRFITYVHEDKITIELKCKPDMRSNGLRNVIRVNKAIEFAFNMLPKDSDGTPRLKNSRCLETKLSAFMMGCTEEGDSLIWRRKLERTALTPDEKDEEEEVIATAKGVFKVVTESAAAAEEAATAEEAAEEATVMGNNHPDNWARLGSTMRQSANEMSSLPRSDSFDSIYRHLNTSGSLTTDDSSSDSLNSPNFYDSRSEATTHSELDTPDSISPSDGPNSLPTHSGDSFSGPLDRLSIFSSLLDTTGGASITSPSPLKDGLRQAIQEWIGRPS